MQKIDTGQYLFVGSRQHVSPFPNYLSLEVMSKEMEALVGAKFEDSIIICEGRMMNFFIRRDVVEKVSRITVAKVEKNPALFRRFCTYHNREAMKFLRFTKRASQEVTKKISDEDLYALFAEFESRYRAMYAPYAPVWVTSDALTARLYEVLSAYLSDPMEISNVLNDLTKEPRAMISGIEKRALLSLAARVQQRKIWKELVLCQATERNKTLRKLIQKHTDDFFWMTRDYEDPVMTYADVVQKLRQMLQGNPEQELKESADAIALIEKTRKKHIRALGLSDHDKAMCAALRDATYLKELRKRHVSEGLCYFDPVLEETARRLFLSVLQVRFMRTADVYEALINKKNLTDEINERIKVSLWHFPNQSGVRVIIGDEADRVRNELCVADQNKKEFFGVAVSPGVARGPAKVVIGSDECGKVEKGDIIVSVQTVPSFSTAIFKSAGLICDGGTGITSHPATLSREAGIPCVIQTRFMREVVRDGDIVEVDGYKGVARIIERK